MVWSHTTRRVLTLQDVSAIKITDYAAIDAAGIDRREVARRLFDTYLKQVFEDGFFHADPHPGNLFVQPGRERRGSREWKLVFVDFGMTGTLAPGTFSALRESLVALGTRDASRMVRSFEALNLLLPGADRDLIERACRRLFETLWGKSTREVMLPRWWRAAGRVALPRRAPVHPCSRCTARTPFWSSVPSPTTICSPG